MSRLDEIRAKLDAYGANLPNISADMRYLLSLVAAQEAVVEAAKELLRHDANEDFREQLMHCIEWQELQTEIAALDAMKGGK